MSKGAVSPGVSGPSRTLSFAGEQCAGCGIYAAHHPMTAVVASEDASVTPLTRSADGKFVAVPVCTACHEDPAHRALPIKGTFFTRAESANAVALAGERDTSGNPVRS